MQIINYSLQHQEHSGLSVVLDGAVQLGEYAGPNDIHAISLGGVRLGASIRGVIENARLLPFAVDVICVGTLIHAIIGEITKQEFVIITDRGDRNILTNLLTQFPELLKD